MLTRQALYGLLFPHPYFRDFEHCLFSLNFNSFSIIFLHGVLAWSWLNVAYNEIKHIVLWDHFWSVSQKGAMTLSFCFFLPFLFVCFRWSLLVKIQFYRMVFNQSHDFSVIRYRNSHFKSCKIYLILKNLYKDRSFVFSPHQITDTQKQNKKMLHYFLNKSNSCSKETWFLVQLF